MSPPMNVGDQLRQQQAKQQQQLRDQMMRGAWQKQQEEKARQQQIQNAIRAAGSAGTAGRGLNIHGTQGVNIDGDVVGRDKLQNINVDVPVETKSGCAFQLERITTFIFSWLIGGIVLAIFGAIIGMVLSNGDGSGASVGAVMGAILALGLAITAASSVKRTK